MTELINDLPWSEYIKGGFLGSSALSAWGTVGLEAWSAEYLEGAYADKKASKFMSGGSALDQKLTGDTHGAQVAVKPETYIDDKGVEKPWNGNANVCKTWIAEHSGYEIITSDQEKEINAALPLAREALAVLQKVNGGTINYQVTLRGEVNGIKVQTRPDMQLNEAFPDLKYVNSQTFSRFDRDFLDSRYFLQAGLAFGFARDLGMNPSASFLLVESGTIHPRCRVVAVPQYVLQAGWDKVRKICDEIAAVKSSALGFVDVVQFSELELPTWAEARIA